VTASSPQSIDVAFLGYGRMAQAISAGLDRSGLAPFGRQAASDPPLKGFSDLAARLGLRAAESNLAAAGSAPLVIVAVKPHQVREVLTEVAPALAGRLLVSIAAGVTLQTLGALAPGAVIVRVIPNLPALAGQGVTLMCAGGSVPPEALQRVRAVFEGVGSVYELGEPLFNEGMAVSGSGPAFFFSFMEAMIRGAARLGLTWDLARELVVKTCLGAAATALASPKTALADLRDQVASPGGATAEGLLELERGALAALVHDALLATADKGRDLG
jgi:pyrroline-5-carboxylate reductase